MCADRRATKLKTDSVAAENRSQPKGNREFNDDLYKTHERAHSSSSWQEDSYRKTPPANTSIPPTKSPITLGRGERDKRYSPASEATSTSSDPGNVYHLEEGPDSPQEMPRIANLVTGIVEHVDQESGRGRHISAKSSLPHRATPTSHGYGYGQEQSYSQSQATSDQGSATTQGSAGRRLVYRGAAPHFSSRRNSRNVSSSSSSLPSLLTREETSSSSSLPPHLTHEETTLSSDGGSSASQTAFRHVSNRRGHESDQKQAYQAASNVTLPGPTSILSSRFPAQMHDSNLPTSTQNHPSTSQATVLPPLNEEREQRNKAGDARHGPSMAALLRAGEMARDADADLTSESRTRRDRRR